MYVFTQQLIISFQHPHARYARCNAGSSLWKLQIGKTSQRRFDCEKSNVRIQNLSINFLDKILADSSRATFSVSRLLTDEKQNGGTINSVSDKDRMLREKEAELKRIQAELEKIQAQMQQKVQWRQFSIWSFALTATASSIMYVRLRCHFSCIFIQKIFSSILNKDDASDDIYAYSSNCDRCHWKTSSYNCVKTFYKVILCNM